MEKEIYKDVPGYEGKYQVSNLGNVVSLKSRWGLRKEPRILIGAIDNHGYRQMNLLLDNKIRLFKVHQLVAMAFLGHTPNGYEQVVNHIDNNPLNNNVDNLELVSQRYNSSCHKTDVGVYWNKERKKWQAQIRINGKQTNLGRFTDKEDALKAYQEAWKNL